ncbi:uncharacterized protein LOC103720339 isoform X4 [Phoenix dactylifera]|uniref:Uncharacterized protein LOC103720339 isoform X4 n=1 Tax=Phoenix dactylifera TaxID=42345 RepID=A0A8B7CXE5_PHODC|nr:uncharacterized protein LOC103720339 isoform X4 [Phoenix dactylifera]
MAAGEKNRAAAIVMNAEIWRTKAWLIEELALKKPCRIFGELHLPHCCPPRLPRMQYSQPSDYEKSGGGQARHLFDGMLKRGISIIACWVAILDILFLCTWLLEGLLMTLRNYLMKKLLTL